MEEELISFETAKLAKEKGFNIFTGKAWIKKEGQDLFFVPVYTGVTNGIDYHAPTQSLLQRWLREVHGIDVIALPTYSAKYIFRLYQKVLSVKNQIYGDYMRKDYANYEEALGKGLYQALKLI